VTWREDMEVADSERHVVAGVLGLVGTNSPEARLRGMVVLAFASAVVELAEAVLVEGDIRHSLGKGDKNCIHQT
jgi:ABC-type tungstate transport system substrate-binding protein